MRHSQYRGRRGPGGAVILVLAILLAAGGAAVWLLRTPAGEAAAPAVTTPPPAPTAPPPTPTPLPEPPAVRGIYVSGPVAGDPYLDTLLALVEDTELNAVVIDVKNDEGRLTYVPDGGMAAEVGAGVRYIRDLPALVARLKERGIYTIARIAAFKDPVLAQARPDLALRGADGSPVSESGGLAWVNPYQRQVWDYLVELSLDAAAAGFDEVQYDYVRFPTGRGAAGADYGPDAQTITREEAVLGFLETARDALHAQGVLVSADVFGTVITSRTDAALIGQDYSRMAQVVDRLCPMVYPSHYAPGVFGLAVPDQEPYQTVYAALEQSRSALSGEGGRICPWLQDFTATWVSGHRTYGPEELRAQIQAVYDAGYDDWMLWNAKNNYTAAGLNPA